MPARPLLRTGVQLFDATLDIQAHVADFAPPSVLLIQGTLDKVTDGQLTRDFLRECGAQDKTYIAYKDAWHALEWEPVDTRMALIHDLTYWVAARVDAWEGANASLASALLGRDAVSVQAWGTAQPAVAAGGGGAASGAPPAATASAHNIGAAVAMGATPPGDADMSWKEEGGVLWGERAEGTGMIPDHDDDFLVVQGGVLPDPVSRLKRPSLGQPSPQEAATPAALDHPPLSEQSISSPEGSTVSAAV